MDAYRNPNYNPVETEWAEELRLAKLAVKKVNQLKPKPLFFVVCGDLTNEFPTGSMSVKLELVSSFQLWSFSLK